jgi:serine/threonine protein kinase
MLTGRRVFEENGALPTILAHVNKVPEPPGAVSESQIPSGLDELVLACLAKDPDDRPASAGELVERLEGVELGRSWTTLDAVGWWDLHRPTGQPCAREP